MKHFAIAALATFGILLANVPTVRAHDASCIGSLSNVTINGNLVVPSGSCTLNGVKVRGNVTVEAGAFLLITSGSKIGGNIVTDDKCVGVSLMGNPITVGGNLQIQGCTGTAGGGVFNGYTQTNGPGLITIGGNFACENNAGPCLGQDGGKVGGNVRFVTNTGGAGNTLAVISLAAIEGNVEVEDNASGDSVVGGNNIGGNLNCQGNGNVTDGGLGANTVGGKKLGQCAGL
jgi:hypothetical protein